MSTKKDVWAIIGAGNGGQSAAGHLGVQGFQVRINDVIKETIDAINEQGGIYLKNGVVNGFGKVEFASLDMGKVVDGADIVMVIAPALYHKTIATDLAKVVQDGQIVFIHPSATGAALEFYDIFEKENCKADVVISEAMSLLYACRSPKRGTASIKGIKRKLMVAALPANKTEMVVEKLTKAFPEMYAGKNVLETSFENLNAVVHPTPTLFNTSLIESGRKWKYYYDGITKSIGDYVVELDKERIEIGKKYNLDLNSVMEWYDILYDAHGENLAETVKDVKAYAEITGQESIYTRYVLEDIPMGLVPQKALADLVGVKTERIDTIINLGSQLLNKDFRNEGRTLKRMGLEGMTIDQILHFVETCEK